MEQRRGDRNDVVEPVRDDLDNRRRRWVSTDTALCALRCPGGSRCQQHWRQRLRRSKWQAPGSGTANRLQRCRSCVHCARCGRADHDDRRAKRFPIGQFDEFGIDHQDVNLLAGEHIAQLRGRESGVQVDDRDAELGGGNGRLDELTMISAGDTKSLTAVESKLAEPVGKLCRVSIELAAADRAAIVDDCCSVRRRQCGRCVRRGERGSPPTNCCGQRRKSARIQQTGATRHVHE